jgi:1-phosphatidylinositol phosphodiesterase
MKHKNLFKLIGIALTAILTAAAVHPIEQASADRSGWMSKLDSTAAINTLTIPGTHDSGALYSFAGVSGKCQSVSIAEQLKMGVRFFDIRLKLEHNELKVVHSFVDQKLTLTKVLADITSFIRKNPTEFLIVSFKEDDSPADSTVTFSEKLEEMLHAHSDTIVPDTSLPETVEQARGKIFVLSRYDGASIGLPARHGWQDSASFALGSMYIQDHYAVSSVNDKQNDILSAVTESESGQYSLVLNFTSCYLDHGFPPLSAAVPARKITPWLMEYANNADSISGVFVGDYMTSALASALIERNFS